MSSPGYNNKECLPEQFLFALKIGPGEPKIAEIRESVENPQP